MKIKKLLFIAVSIFAAAAVFTCGSDKGGGDDVDADLTKAYIWQNVGQAVSDGEAEFTSIAIDKSGTIYVAYSDFSKAFKATVKKLSGSSWVPVGEQGFSDGTAYSIDLAVDPSGTPYVVYEDWAHDNKATVMKFSGSAWEPVGLAGFTLDTAYSPAIAFDSAGTPFVVFEDWSKPIIQASVMKFSGGAWAYVGSGISAGYVYTPRISISSAGAPYVVFEDYSNDFKATVMKYDDHDNNGTITWNVAGNTCISDSYAEYSDIAVTSHGTPNVYVIYSDFQASYKTTVKYFNGTTKLWSTVQTAGISEGDAAFTRIALDGSNLPFVAFSDYGRGNKACVMKINGSVWSSYGTTPYISSGEALYTDLAVSSQGVPYVAFVDCDNVNKAVVMKFVNNSTYKSPCEIEALYNGGVKIECCDISCQ